MIRTNQKLQIAKQNLYNALHQLNYDSSLSWDRLETFTGVTGLTRQQLVYVVNYCNNLMMRNDQRCLKTIRGYGKRILNPAEHRHEAKQNAKRSVRIYRKAGIILGSTNLDELNDDEQAAVIRDAQRFRTLQFFTEELLHKKSSKLQGSATSMNRVDRELFKGVLDLFTSKEADQKRTE